MAELICISTKMFRMNLGSDFRILLSNIATSVLVKIPLHQTIKVTVNVDVKNTGSVDGDEVVQIYVKTPDSPASLERPIKRLRGFKRVTILQVRQKTVSIDIDCADLCSGISLIKISCSIRVNMCLRLAHLQKTSGVRLRPL